MGYKDRGLAEKSLTGPITLLFLAVVGSYYIWLLDPFHPAPRTIGATPATRAAAATPAKRGDADPRVASAPTSAAGFATPTSEDETTESTPTTDSAGAVLVRAPRELELEGHIDSGSMVATGDVVMWLSGATLTESEIAAVKSTIDRYQRRIQAGTDVKQTTRKLDEQERKLRTLEVRYGELIISAPRAGVVMILGEERHRVEGDPLFRVLPN